MRNVAYVKVFVCLLATVGLAGCGSGGGGVTSVSVSPRHAAVVITSQTQQFTATVVGGSGGVNWSVDGMSAGSAAVGTISTTGLYTPPATAGTHTILATSTADSSKSASSTIAVTDLSGVFTHHNDLARDGANTQELALTPAVLNTTDFGKQFSCPVDGAAYTQPLWVPALNIGGAVRNVIFVATQHDSVYAFDADTSPCVQLWQAPLLSSAHGGTAGEIPVPMTDVGSGFQDIRPEIGITGTPVIDPLTSTIYVVSKSEGPVGTFHQRLHALDWNTGNEKFSGPKAISATVPGNGDGSVGGTLSFDPHTQHQRPGLALSNNVVYVGWASHEDKNPYHGWVIGYNAATLAKVSVFNSSANGFRGGIWMAGGAPAIDSAGSLYMTTGNGTFDGNSGIPPNNDFGDTALKLSAGLALTDWFTPFNQSSLNSADLDLGSSGVVVLPDQPTPPTHLLVSAGKQGQVYLLNRDAMGGYCNGCGSDTNTLQNFTAFLNFGSFWSTPAFWQNRLYLGGTQEPPGAGDTVKVFDFDQATHAFATTPSSQSGTVYGYPGSTPSVSSQGTSGGVVWAIDASAYGFPAPTQGPAVLHAYDAMNLTNELWNSSQAAANRDQAGDAVKFTVPTVANGKVYIGTRTAIEVYGLLP
jgi:hypothetical protein